MSKSAILYLQNSKIFQGTGIGKAAIKYGECVFTTGMTGYTESLTDPSYAGQILCFAYPLQGNYNTSKNWYESSDMYAEGVICGSVCENGYHREDGESLENFLKSQNKSAIVGIDTRELVKTLRDEGNQPCVLIVDEDEVIQKWLARIEQVNDFGIIAKMSENASDIGFVNWTTRVNEVNDKAYKNANSYVVESKVNDKHVVVVDCGVKQNIINELSKRFGKVTVTKSSTSSKAILDMDPDAVMYSNGPGDPRDYSMVVDSMKELLETKDLPIMGICLGHQILSLAIGGSVYKMKFGNRGANQPVIDLTTSKAFLTSQNHGYATKEDSLPENYKVLFENLNDGTIEGIYCVNQPVFSVQFHPEACSGPQDTNWLFDKFYSFVIAQSI